jgi:hypothetical protein
MFAAENKSTLTNDDENNSQDHAKRDSDDLVTLHPCRDDTWEKKSSIKIKLNKLYDTKLNGLFSLKREVKPSQFSYQKILPKALGIDEGIDVGLVGLEVGCPVGSPLGLAVGLAEGSEVGWLEVGYEVGGLVSPGRVGRDV